MDNQRLLVWAAFGLLAFMTYEAWVKDHAPTPVAQTRTATDNSTPAPTADATAGQTADGTDDEGLPELAGDDSSTPVVQQPVDNDDEPAASADAPFVHVLTDVLDLQISTVGGTLQSAKIRKYPVEKDKPDELVQLLSTRPSDVGMIMTGLRQKGDGPEPNQFAHFTAAADSYEMNGDTLSVPLSWTNGAGVTVTKTFRFTRGSYRIDVEQALSNGGDTPWTGAEYAQIKRRFHHHERSMFNVDSYSFDGPIVFNGEKSTKLKHDDLLKDGPYSATATGGWLAEIQHHFLSAVIPPADGAYRYNIGVKNEIATSQWIGNAETVAAGSEKTFTTTLFVGPKLQRQLEAVDPKLKLTVDYGWLTMISGPLFWLLSKVHSLVRNWGLAIILVTIMIKAAFYKLTEASGRSMAKMRKIQPRMKALQERYKDDRPALSQAMMELYKREKVNPAAGCLPILIQMPFFLAFYWVLLESVEMRQAPFALWITDLSSRDPYFILPIIMGAAMLFQQHLNPAPADPIQAKVMKVMPIAFTAFFAFFPAGLVLYWVTNTSLSIAQQWRINKVVAAEDTHRGGKKKNKSTE